MQVPLEDTQIKIVPSPKFIKYIQTLTGKDVSITQRIAAFQKGVNKNILQVIPDTKSITPDDVNLVSNLKSHDQQSLNFLNLDLTTNFDNSKPYLTVSDLGIIKDHLSDVYLHELLVDSKIYIPQNEIQERDPELEQRCKILRHRQQNHEYRQMTKNVDCVRARLPEDTIAYQIKEINKQLIAVAQFVLSVLAGFAFGFIGVELIIGSLDFGFRLLLGVICALIIALAEIYFLAKKLNEFNDFLDNSKNESIFPKGAAPNTGKQPEPNKADKPHQD